MPSRFYSKVRDLSHKGLGVIDHPDGRVFFVRGTWPGDEGDFEVDEQAGNYDEARLIRIEKESTDRVPAACIHRGVGPGSCGGCPWMIGTYESQLKFKEKRLRYALEKRGQGFLDIIAPIVSAPNVFNYRNRVQFKTDGSSLGYVSEGSGEFAPIQDCLILNEKLSQLFHEIKFSLPREDFVPSAGFKWNFLDVDDEMDATEVEINRRRPFRQGNTKQNDFMKEWVKKNFEALPKHWPVIDLFCGSGNFTDVIADLKFENILGVEVQGVALGNLKKKGHKSVRILAMDMQQKGAWGAVARAQPHAKAILIDPPREGLTKRRGLFKYLDNLEYIFYVSCELDTFARDARDLVKHGWRAVEIIPLDMFPHTPHVEILSIFRKEGHRL